MTPLYQPVRLASNLDGSVTIRIRNEIATLSREEWSKLIALPDRPDQAPRRRPTVT